MSCSHLYQQRERELAQLREDYHRQKQQWQHDRQQQRERERQAQLAHDHRMAHLLSTARQHASQKDGYAALVALDDLLGNQPSHREALALRESVIRHHGPIDRFDLSRSRTADEMVTLQQGWADHFGVPVEFSNSIGMRLRLVPPGVMPSPRRESNIRLTQGFYMAATPVTQEQYLSIMGNNPSHFWEPKRPVEMVSWHRATEFCRLLTERERASGRIASDQQYQLATATQWEYACRAGTATDYHVGQLSSELSSAAWFSENSNQQTHPVGLKRPNALGLYDMHGNVWEWCSDWYEESLPDQAVDPVGPAAGTLRVVRGGAWNVIPSYCRSVHRLGLDPDSRENQVGFRVILMPLSSP